MKTKLTLLFTAVFFLYSICAAAQVIDPKKETEKEGTKRVNQKIDKGIDKGFDKVEEGIGKLFGKKKNKDKKATENQTHQNNDQSANTEAPATGESRGGEEEPALNWAKYDFVPGDKVIFEDNLEGEENGEFPSRWDLATGGVEIANFGGENVIMFTNGRTQIIPYLKNPGKDYLPDIFTIEFDAWFSNKDQNRYHVILHDMKNQQGRALNRIQILPGGMQGFDTRNTYTGLNLWNKPEKSQWRHIAIGFNVRSLKAYFDDERLINIPHLGFNPTGVTIELEGSSQPNNYLIKNIRIAEGGQKLYDKFLQDGKIVANGIRFDVNKATLRPESMGIINEIADLMKENPDIKFSVEGHTDSDGDDVLNQTLSEQRAATVVNTLTKMGIDTGRMTSRGWGENQPLDTNNTPEGKANNRRVEFVKM